MNAKKINAPNWKGGRKSLHVSINPKYILKIKNLAKQFKKTTSDIVNDFFEIIFRDISKRSIESKYLRSLHEKDNNS